MKIVGIRRLVGGGITHALNSDAIWIDVTNITACGIQFTGYSLDHENPESSLRYMFRIADVSRGSGITLMRGTFEDLEVDCISCLVRMRTWNQS